MLLHEYFPWFQQGLGHVMLNYRVHKGKLSPIIQTSVLRPWSACFQGDGKHGARRIPSQRKPISVLAPWWAGSCRFPASLLYCTRVYSTPVSVTQGLNTKLVNLLSYSSEGYISPKRLKVAYSATKVILYYPILLYSTVICYTLLCWGSLK